MKKFRIILAIFAIAGMFLATSCTSDDTTDPPIIKFKTETGYTYQNVTVAPGSDIHVGIEANAQGTSTLKRFNFSVAGSDNISQSVFDSTFTNATFTYDAVITAQTELVPLVYIFTIYDDQNQSSQIKFTVTTEGAAGNIVSYENVSLGAQNSATGSSFASSNGNVYQLAEAKLNSALIDWVYFYNTSLEAVIGAPDDADVHEAFKDYKNGPQSWDTKNPTKFKTVTLPEGVTWASITNDVVINQLATDVVDSKVSFLGVGSVVAFKTIAGKLGLLRIEAITPDASDPPLFNKGTITYSLKMQE